MTERGCANENHSSEYLVPRLSRRLKVPTARIGPHRFMNDSLMMALFVKGEGQRYPHGISDRISSC
jgi:hypothetical protein